MSHVILHQPCGTAAATPALQVQWVRNCYLAGWWASRGLHASSPHRAMHLTELRLNLEGSLNLHTWTPDLLLHIQTLHKGSTWFLFKPRKGVSGSQLPPPESCGALDFVTSLSALRTRHGLGLNFTEWEAGSERRGDMRPLHTEAGFEPRPSDPGVPLLFLSAGWQLRGVGGRELRSLA